MGDNAKILERITTLEAELRELRRAVQPPLKNETLPTREFSILPCRIGDAQAAFVNTDILEVVMVAKLASIPESPAWIRGILNLRGQVVPVIDVWQRIHRCSRSLELSDRIVVCKFEGAFVGLLVQEVFSVRRCDPASVQAPPSGIPHAPYVLGLLGLDGDSRLLMSTERLITTSDLGFDWDLNQENAKRED